MHPMSLCNITCLRTICSLPLIQGLIPHCNLVLCPILLLEIWIALRTTCSYRRVIKRAHTFSPEIKILLILSLQSPLRTNWEATI